MHHSASWFADFVCKPCAADINPTIFTHHARRPSTMNTPHNTTAFELHAGSLRSVVCPDLGGSVAGLWHHGEPVLRSAEAAALTASIDAAIYPLVPYSNRLGYRRFRWKGQDHTTAANFGDEQAHSLHGVGWQRPWVVESHQAHEIVMVYRHTPDADWPFAFEARQHLSLAVDALRMQMSITNTDEQTSPAPVGLGWHPFFPARTQSRLHLEVSDRWDLDAAHLPVRKVAQPGIDSHVQHLDFDHCFDGWNGSARIRDERFSLQLRSSLDRVVVYTPAGQRFFCVEPVSHVSNAIHMADPAAHGLRSLKTGETFEAWMQLDISVL
jgi:aldose 1-epimerase